MNPFAVRPLWLSGMVVKPRRRRPVPRPSHSSDSKPVSRAQVDAICKDVAVIVHTTIPEDTNKGLSKEVFDILHETIFEASFEALDIVMAVTGDDASSTKAKLNAGKEVSVSQIAGSLARRVGQDLPGLIDDGIEFAVRETWSDYVDVPLCITIDTTLEDHNLGGRSKELMDALDEYAAHDMSLKFVPKEVRAALRSAINGAMLETKRAVAASTHDRASPNAVTGMFLPSVHTSLRQIIKVFAKESLQPVADAACAIVTELMKEVLYDANGDAASVSALDKDGDGDIGMGGC